MFNRKESIKPIEIPSGNAPAGIGYIVIPDDESVDRDKYVEDCYRSHTVTMYGGQHYGFFFDVSIDSQVLKHIQFPKEKNTLGTPVVWVNIKPWNKPVIISLLKSSDDYYLNDEGELNMTREWEGNHVDISTKAKKGTFEVNISTNAGVKGAFRVNIVNPDKTCEFPVYVKGKVKIHATEETKIVSDKKIQLHVVDEDSKDRVVITYEREKGFTYIDEFENEINIKDGQLQIKSEKINHGDGAEPMVLGDTLKSVIGELIDAISAITVPTAFGPSGTPINSAQFSSIKGKLDTILSKISNLD